MTKLDMAFSSLEKAEAALASERAAHARTQMMLDQEQERLIFIDAAREAAEARLAEAMKCLDDIDRRYKNGAEADTLVWIARKASSYIGRVREGGEANG